MNTDKLIFNSLLINPKWLNHCPESIFKEDEIRKIFNLIKEFYNKFSEIPEKQQIRILVESENLDLPIDYLENLLDFNPNDYSEDWLKTTIENTIIWTKFKNTFLDCIDYVKSNNSMDPMKVPEVIEKVKNMMSNEDVNIFSEELGTSFWDTESHFVKDSDFVPTCHNWIDNLLGGYLTGTLNVYCGYANVGKSIFLCNDAANYCLLGENVLYLTLEMSEEMTKQRIGSNIFDFPIDFYRKLDKKNYILNKIEDFHKSRIYPLGELLVKQFPTGTLTVPQLETYLKSVKGNKGFLPKIVVIDYINLMSNYRNPNSENTYLKIKQIAEDLRALAIRLNIVIITATQLNRSGADVSDFNLSSISESQGLINTADTIFGIIQTTEMNLSKEYYLKIMRVRSGGGKNQRCRYEIDYTKMRLTETNEISTYEI